MCSLRASLSSPCYYEVGFSLLVDFRGCMEAPLVQWSNELRKQEEAPLLRDNAESLS